MAATYNPKLTEYWSVDGRKECSGGRTVDRLVAITGLISCIGDMRARGFLK